MLRWRGWKKKEGTEYSTHDLLAKVEALIARWRCEARETGLSQIWLSSGGAGIGAFSLSLVDLLSARFRFRVGHTLESTPTWKLSTFPFLSIFSSPSLILRYLPLFLSFISFILSFSFSSQFLTVSYYRNGPEKSLQSIMVETIILFL